MISTDSRTGGAPTRTGARFVKLTYSCANLPYIGGNMKKIALLLSIGALLAFGAASTVTGGMDMMTGGMMTGGMMTGGMMTGGM